MKKTFPAFVAASLMTAFIGGSVLMVGLDANHILTNNSSTTTQIVSTAAATVQLGTTNVQPAPGFNHSGPTLRTAGS